MSEYNKNPNICLSCREPIQIRQNEKVSQTRIKKYCGSSCAARRNGTLYPKRSVTKCPCLKCGVNEAVIRSGSNPNKLCQKCLDEYRARVSLLRKDQSSHPKIRSHARAILTASGRQRSCARCGYDKHVECCHLMPVAEFPPETLLGVINAQDNLVWLCPNHHWEMDHGIV